MLTPTLRKLFKVWARVRLENSDIKANPNARPAAKLIMKNFSYTKNQHKGKLTEGIDCCLPTPRWIPPCPV